MPIGKCLGFWSTWWKRLQVGKRNSTKNNKTNTISIRREKEKRADSPLSAKQISSKQRRAHVQGIRMTSSSRRYLTDPSFWEQTSPILSSSVPNTCFRQPAVQQKLSNYHIKHLDLGTRSAYLRVRVNARRYTNSARCSVHVQRLY